MSKVKIYKYVGKGAFVPGFPTRDIPAAEWNEFTKLSHLPGEEKKAYENLYASMIDSKRIGMYKVVSEEEKPKTPEPETKEKEEV